MSLAQATEGEAELTGVEKSAVSLIAMRVAERELRKWGRHVHVATPQARAEVVTKLRNLPLRIQVVAHA